MSKLITRIFCIVLAAILLANIFPVLTFAAEQNTKTTQNHSFGQYEAQDSLGHIKTCSGCGTQIFEKHFRKWTIIKLPTLYSEGEGYFHCTNCSYVSEHTNLPKIISSAMVKVEFNPNGGTLETTNFSIKRGSYDFALAEEPTRDGYCFRGWALSEDASIPDFFPNEKILYMDSDVVYYAVWRKLYGYTFLNEKQQELYHLLTSQLKHCAATISIPSSLRIKPDDLDETVEMIISDHPDYFWFLGGYSYGYSSTTGNILRMSPKYTLSGKIITEEEMLSARTVFHNKIKEILAQMHSEVGDSDYERALWIHDKVCELVEYEFGNNHQTAYGALVEGEAVCAGYARLYQYLLNCAGIDAWSVNGKSVVQKTNEYISHMWTIMWLDGHCLYSDVTWDDQSDEKYHMYFALSYDQISVDHIADADYANKLPQCCEDGCNSSGYFDSIHPECKLSDNITTAIVGNLLEQNEDGRSWSFSVYDPNGTKFYTWIKTQENYSNIIETYLPQVGAYRLQFSMISGGKGAEVHVTFINTWLPVTGDFNGDEVVDARDLVRLKRILANVGESDSANPDLDGNGRVDSVDISNFRKKLLKGIKVH